MYKALKIEIKLTEEQKIQINKIIGVERFIYIYIYIMSILNITKNNIN